MSQFGKELKTYSENGLKSAAAWLALGRKVGGDSTPRANVSHRGAVVELFSRDQTERRVSERRAE